VAEIERRAWSVAGRATGNSIAAGVTVLATMIGLGGAEATTVGALGGSVAEEGVAIVASWRARRLRNVERFGSAASEAAAESLSDLLREAAANPYALELLAQTAEAAARSLDDWKIDLLARAFVDGLRNQDNIDVAAVTVDAVRQIEVLHLYALDRLPATVYEAGEERYTNALPIPDLARPSEIASRLGPDLSEVIHMVMGKLVTLGLAVEVDRGTWETLGVPAYMITRLGDRVRHLLRERGSLLDEPSSSPRARGC
jgi:hypothetical protein